MNNDYDFLLKFVNYACICVLVFIATSVDESTILSLVHLQNTLLTCTGEIPPKDASCNE